MLLVVAGFKQLHSLITLKKINQHYLWLDSFDTELQTWDGFYVLHNRIVSIIKSFANIATHEVYCLSLQSNL